MLETSMDEKILVCTSSQIITVPARRAMSYDSYLVVAFMMNNEGNGKN
jgi:hypothetical protein